MSPNEPEYWTALGRRAVACKRWRWMFGMLTMTGHRFAVQVGGVPEGEIPDLRDPATVGCLLAMVREAHGCEDAFCTRSYGNGPGGYGGWIVKLDIKIVGRGATEAEALVGALEVAP